MSAAAVTVQPDPSLRGTLLVVDDEALLLRAFARVLMRAGHEVVQASDGAEAAMLVGKRRFDCAFVDLGLPGAGGLEVLAALRARDPGLPVVLMTGAPTLDSAIDAVAAGALRYLVKPIESPDLLAAAADGVRMRRRESVDRYDQRQRDGAANAASLDRAFASLYMAYQPIVRWGRRELYAYEALVRTREPSVPHPGVLIDLAQRLDRLPELGRRIRAAVATTASSSMARLFVNLHPIDLLDEELFDPAAPLSHHARRVVLEVTERAGLDEIADLGDRLRRLRALGYRVAIDDLGEGYAGLTSLARVAPEFVKLDMSLVRGIDSSAAQRQIVSSTVQLCRALGSEIIAEGVETAAERDALVTIGLDLLQGFLIGRPLAELTVPKL